MSAVALPPRDYQIEAVDAVEGAFARGVARVLVVMPCGTGKTVLFAHLIVRRRGLGRALVLAHRTELLDQAAAKLRAIAPGIEVGVVRAERDETDAQVVVASVQTLSRPGRLERLGSFATIVVDEAHHAPSESYLRVLGGLGALEGESGPLTLGVTATPERSDRQSMAEVFEEVVYELGLLEAIRAGHLCDLRGVRVQVAVDLDAVPVREGDFAPAALERALHNANAPAAVVAAYTEHADGRRALAFSPTVSAAEELAEAFRGAGIAAQAASARTPGPERADLLRSFGRGEISVLCNAALFNEGVDVPAVDCIIVARPTRSRALYVQQVGRGTRRHPGKRDCLVIDVMGASVRHDLLSVAGLFNLSDDTDLCEHGVAEISSGEGGGCVEVGPEGEIVSRAVDLLARDLSWVEAEEGFALSIGTGQMLVIRPRGPGWDVLVHRRGAGSERVAEGLPFGYAMGTAEDYARRAGAEVIGRRDAAWRARPATERQLRVLRRWGMRPPPGLLQGEASDLISLAAARVAWRDLAGSDAPRSAS